MLPKKLRKLANDHRIEEIRNEGGDGYWIYLKPGWWLPHMETHCIHEYTQAACLDEFKEVRPHEDTECEFCGN